MSANTSWIALGLLAALGAAGVAIFGKLAMTQGQVVSATLARSLIMSAALVLFALARGVPLTPTGASAATWLWIVLAGLCGAGSWLAYFAALRVGPATAVAVLDRGSLVFTFVLAYLVLGERAGPRAWAGLALIVLGMVLVVTAPPTQRATIAAPIEQDAAE